MARILNNEQVWKKQSDGSLRSPVSGNNYTQLDSDGVVTFAGNAERKLTLRPSFNYTQITAQGKPTQVIVGVFSGFSLPIYNNDNEELFFKLKVPERWDGVTNPKVSVCAWLASGEDVGDKFNLQLSYNAVCCTTQKISSTVYDVPVETTLVEGVNEQYSTYNIHFELDATKMFLGSMLGCRLRRIAASGNECSGEIVIYTINIEFNRDKMGGQI